MSNTFDFNKRARLASDPELRFSPNGQPIASFRVAIDDRKKLEDGSWETTQTVFHDAAAFGKQAERLAALFQSGDAVLIFGRLEAKMNTKDGKTYTNWRINVDHMAPDPILSNISIDRTSRGLSTTQSLTPSAAPQDPWAEPAAGIDA